MELIVLHGPPGVGKLTVARVLAKRTGFRVFHNHLTYDLALSLFDRGTEECRQLVEDLRLDLLARAARARVPGVIFTFVYGVGVDDAFMEHLIEAVEAHGATVHLVLLTCDEDILMERVAQPARREHQKLLDPEILQHLLREYQLMTPVPHRSGLTIDNSRLPPDAVADAIIAWLHDQRVPYS